MDCGLAGYSETTFVEDRAYPPDKKYIVVGIMREELDKLPGPRVSPEPLGFIKYFHILNHLEKANSIVKPPAPLSQI